MNFHHIGYACVNIEVEQRSLTSLGYTQEGADFEDPIQCVRGRFLVGGGPRIELLEQLDGENVLSPWLDKGTKMYHIAYEVNAMTEAVDKLAGEGAKLIVSPVPAIAFDNREIAFLLTRTMLLVELIQR